MFVICNKETKIPIRIWLENVEDIEEGCLKQAYALANLPFLHKWVSLMPDTHLGMGMPIGGVIAAKNVIIPNAVGVDIGCGMCFVGTTIKYDDIKDIETGNGSLIQAIVGDIMRNIPVGFNHHKEKQECEPLDIANKEIYKYKNNPELLKNLQAGYYQVGTLGGGNHFIELQVDEEGFIGIMIHSGSRNFGKQVCDHFNKIAVSLNEKWYSDVPKEYKLAFLPTETEEGKQYIDWMNLSLDFAMENRRHMMDKVKEILENKITKFKSIKFDYTIDVNCHHNYASLEHHFNKNVWVHRKGATRARIGELGIIPGAMGSYSYIVYGRGNPGSFCSSSHGAGRRYSRKKAIEAFSVESVMIDLKDQNVVLGKKNKEDIAEESRFAYKDIEDVMENQKDLVTPIKKLKTIAVVKG